MHIEQVSMISLQNTRNKPAASMPNKPCFLPRSIRIDKTVQILKLACKICLKGLMMLTSGCGQSFCTCATVPYQFNCSGYATANIITLIPYFCYTKKNVFFLSVIIVLYVTFCIFMFCFVSWIILIIIKSLATLITLYALVFRLHQTLITAYLYRESCLHVEVNVTLVISSSIIYALVSMGDDVTRSRSIYLYIYIYLSRMNLTLDIANSIIPSDHMARFNQLAKKLVSSLPLVSRELTTKGAKNGIPSLIEASTSTLTFRIELFRPLWAVECKCRYRSILCPSSLQSFPFGLKLVLLLTDS